jgi:hypothetical protein
MRRSVPFLVFIAVSLLCTLGVARADGLSSSKTDFVFRDRDGKLQTATLVTKYQPNKIVYPLAKIDRRLDPKLVRAATIAQERAHAHSRSACWRYVKEALVAAGVISSYPKTPLAKQAGKELVATYGFVQLAVSNPFAAPLGAVLVYGARGAGHVEIRTKDGFVSDFCAKTPSHRPLLGVYVKK